MRIPFIKYAEALMACKLNGEEVLSLIKQTGIPGSDTFKPEYLQEIWKELVKSNPEYFKPTYSGFPQSDWLQGLGILEVVAHTMKLEIPGGTQKVLDALDLLKDREMYETITALALANITEEDIELLTNGKYNIHYDADSVKLFLKYFFDVSDWTIGQKRDYIKEVKDRKLLEIYDLALAGDKNFLIWKLGLAPELEFDELLRTMATDGYFFFKQNSTKAQGEEARRWMKSTLEVMDRLNKLGKERENDEDLVNKISFIFQNNPKENSDGFSITLDNKIKHISELNNDEE